MHSTPGTISLPNPIIREASHPKDLATIRTLLREYANYLNTSVGAEHINMKAYEKELADLPGVYAPLQGTLLLAFIGDEPAGCGALKPITPKLLATNAAIPANENACEMKRLWVSPQFRGRSLGKQLAQALIRHAQQAGYTAIYLDTIPAAMQSANHLYHDLGFEPAEQYAANPVLSDNTMLKVCCYRRSL